MAKNKKQIGADKDESSRGEVAIPKLDESEVEVSLICLKYFRGDWDLYLDFLHGPRVTDVQRRRELPLVERLREQDRRSDFLAYFLEDELMVVLQKLGFGELLRIWEECLVLHPEDDPFPEHLRRDGENPDSGDVPPDEPSTLH